MWNTLTVSLLVCLTLVPSQGLVIQREVDPQENSQKLIQSENKETIGPIQLDLKLSALIQLNLGQYLSNLPKNNEAFGRNKRYVPNDPSLDISNALLPSVPETSKCGNASLPTSIPEISNASLPTSIPEIRNTSFPTSIPETSTTSLPTTITPEISDTTIEPTLSEETNQTDSNTIYQTLLKVYDDQQNITASLAKLQKKQESTDNMIRQLMNVTKSISQLQQHLYEQQQSPHSDNVHTIDGTSGVISYDESLMSYSNRKFWVLERTTSVEFSIEHMNLSSNAHLTFTGITSRGEKNEISFSSATQRGTEITEFKIDGCVIVVTLIMKEVHPDAHPSFNLTFNNTKDNSRPDKRKYATNVITTDGLTHVSYPENNIKDYPNDVSYLWLIAPFSAKPFELTLKFLETENCTASKPKDFLKVFSIQHRSTRSTYELQGRPHRSNMFCGREKEINPPEFIGHSTASILFFSSDRSMSWKGFKVQVKTFDLPQALPIFS